VEWAAVEDLHERYLREIFRYVLRRVPRREEAEDITAQVFAAAYEALPRYRGDCPIQLWLLGIARRKVAVALRRRAARRETLVSELAAAGDPDPVWAALAATEGPEAALFRSEARRIVRELLAHLTADQREALLLQYVEQLAVAEIALVMERSPASVTGLLQRARATLFRRGRAYFLDETEETER
jgi:RNA polymerase sigma-70 factor (ECF subfamily)